MYFLFCSCSHSGPANRYCFQWTESVSKASMEVGKRIDYFEYECRERERDKKKGINCHSISLCWSRQRDRMRLDYWLRTHISIVCPMNVDASNWKRDLSSGVNVRHHSTLSNAMLNHDIISEIIRYSTLGSIKIFHSIIYKNENSLGFSSSHHHSHFSRLERNRILSFVQNSCCLSPQVCEQCNCLLCSMKLKYLFLIR